MSTKLSQFCSSLMEAAWIAAAILTPVFFNVFSSRIFEPDKITLLRSLALLILAAWIVKIIDEGKIHIEGLKSGESPVIAILRIPMAAPVTMLALVYLASTIFSITPRASLYGSYQRLQGTYSMLSYIVIFAAIAGNLRQRTQVERLTTAIAIASLPVGLYGILQRYKIDPIPWGGEVSTRIASNMGNSIFVAAYLIMAFFLTAKRVIETFSAILTDERRLFLQVARATVYVFILAIQLIAIYMSGSRGPALGLMAGSFFMLYLLSLYWRKRWLTFTILVAAVFLGGFLVVFNIPNGPFETLRQSPAIGRFGTMLDEESNTAKVRKYIWKGVVPLVLPHTPLEYPDGKTDSFNLLRPLIGYGPESMYVAYNRFYPPDLGTVEKRNASPDRSHNETWDSIVITGLLGLVAYLAVFTSCFYYGLKWLGLIRSGRQRAMFFALLAGGAIAGVVAFTSWRGPEYFGLGLPFGAVGGLLLYLSAAGVFFPPPSTDRSPNDLARELMILSLLSAVVAHFIEINFGIAIAATRTYFYIYAALILVNGAMLNRSPAEALPASSGAKEPSPSPAKAAISDDRLARQKRRHTERETPVRKQGGAGWLDHLPAEAGIAALVLITLGYNFISNSSRETTTLGVLAASLTRLPNKGNAFSYGVLAFILTTWLATVILLAAEDERVDNARQWFTKALRIMGVSGLFAIIFWLFDAGNMAALVRTSPTNIQELLTQVDQIAGFLTTFYVFVFLVIGGMAFFLARNSAGRARSSSGRGLGAAAVMLLVFVAMVYATNLRVIHADVSYKMAEPFNKGDQWPVATRLYQRALQLTPYEDFYYLFLGRSYLEQAKLTQDIQDLDRLVLSADADLKIAQKINPLNTDHTANLGRLYSWYATRASGEDLRRQRGEISSDYYARAVTLSPQNSTLWGEWAVLYMDVLNDPVEAYNKLAHILEVDPNYTWTLSLMGNYYVRQTQVITDTAKRQELYEKALEYFDKAVKVKNTYQDQQTLINSWLSLADVYRALNKADESIAAYQQAYKMDAASANNWKIKAIIAQLYAQKGDKANALANALEAQQLAPTDQKSSLDSFITQVKAMP